MAGQWLSPKSHYSTLSKISSLTSVVSRTAGLDPEERIRFRNLLVDTAARCTVILSTHIVEDIGQSSNAIAVLDGGQVRFAGNPRELIDRARGQVWTFTLPGDQRPDNGLSIVSTRQMADGVVYRVVGSPPEAYAAEPAEPSLEDGYLWLMRVKDRG